MDKNLRSLHITTSVVAAILWIVFFIFTDTSLGPSLPLEYKLVIAMSAATLLVPLPVSIICLIKSKGSYVFGWLVVVASFLMLFAFALDIYVIKSVCKIC